MWYIYLIKSSACDEVYIGSTRRNIRFRFAEHIYQFRIKKGNCTVNCILEKGIEQVSQELLEEIDTNDIRILLNRERWWIDQTPNVVNYCVPARDREERFQIYNERAKERRKAKTQPTKCECGFTYYYGHKEKHEQTRRHKQHILNISKPYIDT